jgi:hypothetical protein
MHYDTESLRSQTKRHLELALTGLPDDMYLVLWAKKGGKRDVSAPMQSFYVQTVAEAIPHVDAMRYEGWNVYLSECAQRTPMPSPLRGSTDNITAGHGFWVDADIEDLVHKKSRLPKTRMSALDMIGQAFPGRAMSLTVDTGHGIQTRVLGKTWTLLDTPALRDEWYLRVLRFQRQIQRVYEENGVELDMTYDLARVMRLAGTFNYGNPEDVVPCTIIGEGPLYDLDAFAQNDLCVTVSPTALQSFDTSAFAACVFHRNNVNLSEKLVTLMGRNKLVNDAVRQRKDTGDMSGSGCDFTIARCLLLEGWTYQELLDDLVAIYPTIRNRQAKRMDYYFRTIQKAHDTVKQAQEKDAGMTSQERLAQFGEESTLHRQGCTILSLKRWGQDESTYVMEVEVEGEVRELVFPSSEHILTVKLFNQHIGDTLGAVVPHKQAMWVLIAGLALKAADTVEKSTSKSRVEDALTSYFQSCTLLTATDDVDVYEKALKDNLPHVYRGAVYFSVTAFKRYLDHVSSSRTGREAMTACLTQSGWKYNRCCQRLRGRDKEYSSTAVITRVFYSLPVDDFTARYATADGE